MFDYIEMFYNPKRKHVRIDTENRLPSGWRKFGLGTKHASYNHVLEAGKILSFDPSARRSDRVEMKIRANSFTPSAAT